MTLTNWWDVGNNAILNNVMFVCLFVMARQRMVCGLGPTSPGTYVDNLGLRPGLPL